jgi:hypothetical protein
VNMILGISPLVQGDRRRWLGVEAWLLHILGGVVGGASTALVVWVLTAPIRTLLSPTALTTLMIALVAYAILRHFVHFRLPWFPQRDIQVPKSWFSRFGARSAYLRYGAVLGAGLVTYVPNSLVYCAFIGAALLQPLQGVIVSGAAFGFGRTFLVGPGAALAPQRLSLTSNLGRLSREAITLSTVVTVALLAWLIATLFR